MSACSQRDGVPTGEYQPFRFGPRGCCRGLPCWLRRATEEGNPIYAVYRVAGRTQRDGCSAVRAAGGGAYGKWLNDTTDPSYIIPC